MDRRFQPLAGIRVLDFTHVLAGPMCTRLLTDLGADVVRVESKRRPDALRSAKAEHVDRSLAYVMMHRGKQSIALDLKSQEGLSVARRLAAVADVVVENFSAGVMGRLGLDYASLQPENPRLIFVSMSGYGQDGPRRDWTSMNNNLQAYSGLMMATGTDDQPPVATSNSWMDYIGGLEACAALLDRLLERESTGAGCLIDLSQFECGVSTLGAALLGALVDGSAPQRIGNRSDDHAPQGNYPCEGQDEWCTISVEDDAQWEALGMTVGAPWCRDARFGTLAGRTGHHDEIDRRLVEWTRTLPASAVESRLTAAGVRAAKMRRMNEVLADSTSDSAFRFTPNGAKPVLQTVLPFGLAPREEPAFGATAALGENTDVVLKDWLGLDGAEIAHLHAAGALT